MQLKSLKMETCPICGCDIVIKESIETFRDKLHTHCNGEHWEHRTFICGQEIVYIPNFRDIEFSKYNVCKNNEEYKKEQARKNKALIDVLAFIDTLDTTDEHKSRLKNAI